MILSWRPSVDERNAVETMRENSARLELKRAKEEEKRARARVSGFVLSSRFDADEDDYIELHGDNDGFDNMQQHDAHDVDSWSD